MRLYYIANARIPTEKAHGSTIMKSCEAFAREGIHVTLVVPYRRNALRGDPFSYYGLAPLFRIVVLPAIDIFFLERLVGRFTFWVHLFSFYVSLFFWILFQSRKIVIYSRDTLSVFLALLQFEVVFECHLIPSYKRTYFALQRMCKRIIVISGQLRRIYAENGYSESQILVAPSGVDTDVFSVDLTKEEARKKLDLPMDMHIIGYFGNFTTMGQDKGINDILGAVKHLPSTVLFLAVGGGNRDVAHYKEKAAQESVADQCIFLGRIKQQQLAEYQKACDILLMPFPDTHHYRNHMSPVKMFEYMASGRPIIATRLPTITEVLNNDTALLIEPGDQKGLEGAVELLLENNDLATKLAGEARREVEKYSWRERTKSILHFIT